MGNINTFLRCAGGVFGLDLPCPWSALVGNQKEGDGIVNYTCTVPVTVRVSGVTQ